MVVIVFEGSHSKVVGPFNNLRLAQEYLAKNGYRAVSEIYWVKTQQSHTDRADITVVVAPS